MNSGLLTCSDSNRLSTLGIAYRVRLGILEGNHSDGKVNLCLLGKVLILSYDVVEEIIINLEFISTLLEGNSENLLPLKRCGNIRRINLDHIVVTILLGRQNLECFRSISRSNNTIRYFSLNNQCGCFITGI